MKKKKSNLLSAILWAAITVVWTVTVFMNIFSGQAWGLMMALQCACILASGANAVVGFVKYKRAANNKETQ